MGVFVGALLCCLVTTAPCVHPATTEAAENFLVVTENQIAVNVDTLVDNAAEVVTADAGLTFLLTWLVNMVELV